MLLLKERLAGFGPAPSTEVRGGQLQTILLRIPFDQAFDEFRIYHLVLAIEQLSWTGKPRFDSAVARRGY